MFVIDNSKKILREIVWVSFQIYLQNIFQMIDNIVIGKYDEEVISVVNIASQPLGVTRKIMAIVVLGYVVLVPRTLTRQEDIKKEIGGIAIILIIGISLGSILILRFCSGKILSFILKENMMVEIAENYFKIVCYSIFFENINILFTSILRCNNNVKYGLLCNVYIYFLNVISDVYIVFCFKIYVIELVALSTIISQVIGTMLMAMVIKKKRLIRFPRNLNGALDILKIGVPSSIDSLVYTLVQFLINSIMCRKNPLILTAYIYMSNFSNILTSISEGVGNIIGIEVGKSCGEKKYDIAKQSILYIGKKYAVVNIILILFWSKITHFFISISGFSNDLQFFMNTFLPYFTLLVYFQSFNIYFGIVLKNSGDSKFICLLSIIASIIKVIIIELTCIRIENVGVGVCIILLIDEFVRSIMTMKRIRNGRGIKGVKFKREVL